MTPEQPDALETYALLGGLAFYLIALGYALYTLFGA